jgi:signal transduction histidine kinase
MCIVITSMMFVLVFSVVYVEATVILTNNHRAQLESILTDYKWDLEPKEPSVVLHDVFNKNFRLYFVLTVDQQGWIYHKSSSLELPHQERTNYVQEFLIEDGKLGITKLLGRDWRYLVSEVTDLELANCLTNGADPSRGCYVVAFMDITYELYFLRQLSLVLFLSTAAIIIIVILTSRVLTMMMVKPVERAWHKHRRFVANASHALKTPLAIIASNTDVLLANRDQTIQSQRHWLHNIQVGIKRSTDLVNILVSLLRLESKELVLNLETYDFGDNLKTTLRAHAPRMKKRQLHLITKIEPKVVVTTDRVLASLLFASLLDNAIKYTNKGGKIWVTVRSLGNGHNWRRTVECKISNTGPGIEPKELGLIFERFYRGKRCQGATDVEGHGLGLSIVRILLKRIGGKIEVHSEPGKLTSFTYRLPMKIKNQQKVTDSDIVPF